MIFYPSLVYLVIAVVISDCQLTPSPDGSLRLQFHDHLPSPQCRNLPEVGNAGVVDEADERVERPPLFSKRAQLVAVGEQNAHNSDRQVPVNALHTPDQYLGNPVSVLHGLAPFFSLLIVILVGEQPVENLPLLSPHHGEPQGQDDIVHVVTGPGQSEGQTFSIVMTT